MVATIDGAVLALRDTVCDDLPNVSAAFAAALGSAVAVLDLQLANLGPFNHHHDHTDTEQSGYYLCAQKVMLAAKVCGINTTFPPNACGRLSACFKSAA